MPRPSLPSTRASSRSRREPPDGAGGQRTAYVDEILFIPVPDQAMRLAGVQKGEYHYAQIIKQDQYGRLLTLPGVEPRIWKLGSWITAVLNHKQGVMTSKKVRQAAQAALDMEPIMAAAIGHPDVYRLDPSLFPPEQWPWHSKAGGSALVASQQLEEIGLRIDLQVYDWPTLVQRRTKPELWDVFSTGHPFYEDPVMHGALLGGLGWWRLEEKERLVAEIRRESDLGRRKAILERIQTLFYEDVGQIKLGDYYYLDAVRKELRGQFRAQYIFAFWNAWLETVKR